MSFGWSVGDIIAAIDLLAEVVQALDSVNGAADNYRQGILFLKRLIRTLEPLKTFTDIDARPTFRDEICKEVDAIKIPVEDFLAIVMKYESSLGPTASKGYHRHVGRKLQWHYSEAKKLEKLEVKIDNHMRTLDILLQRLTIDIIHSTQNSLPAKIRAVFTEVLDERLRSAFRDDLKPLEANVLALREEVSQSHRALLGYLEKNMLITSALDTILETIMDSKKNGMAKSLEGPRVTDLPDSPDRAERDDIYTAAELRSNVSRLVVQDLFVPDAACVFRASQFRPDKRVDAKLRWWWTESQSSHLWIQEPLGDRSASLIATSVFIAAQRAEIPVIRFCCVDEYGPPAPLQLLIKLVHSFIYQLAYQVQPVFTSEADLASSRFDSLDKSVEALPLALDLLRDLICVYSKPLICEIDWFHLLENRRSRQLMKYLKELLGILRSPINISSGSPRIMKLLITTPGQSLMLLEEFKPGERLDSTDPTEEHYRSITSSLAQIPHGTRGTRVI